MATRPPRRTGSWLAPALVLTGLLAAGGCGGSGGAGDQDAAMRPGAPADTAALSATAGFVETSAAFTDAGILAILDEANESDSAAAALALDHAGAPEVKAFAAAMMQEHHALRTKGERLEERLSLSPQLPASDPLAPTLDDEMLTLRATPTGPVLDRVYVEKELAVHQAILDFTERARRGTPNPRIRAYIDEVTPVIRRHLARVQALEKKLAPAG